MLGIETLIMVILALVLVGVALYLIKLIPMDETIRQVIKVLVILAVIVIIVFMILQVLGLGSGLNLGFDR